jgi:tripartite ATP-independent transporter DctM subunit
MILVYGPMAGVSVGKLLMGAFIPGIILALMYIVYVLIICYLKPEKGPGISDEDEIIPLKRKLKLFAVSVLPVGTLILAVLGSIFFGLTAPTEAAALGCFGSLLLSLLYRSLTLEKLKGIIYQTVKVSSMVFLVVVGAKIYTSVFMRLGCSRVVENLIMALPVPDWGVLLLMFLIVFIMGAFIDWIGILMIVVPLFTPIAANLGVDAIWFAMMIIIVMQTSFLTPPFAYSIFYLKGIAPPEVTTWDIYRGVFPFILIQLLGVILFYNFPQIILFLPNMMVK